MPLYMIFFQRKNYSMPYFIFVLISASIFLFFVLETLCNQCSRCWGLTLVISGIQTKAGAAAAPAFFHGAPGMARDAQAPPDQPWWLVGDLGVRPRRSSVEVKSPTDPDGGNR